MKHQHSALVLMARRAKESVLVCFLAALRVSRRCLLVAIRLLAKQMRWYRYLMARIAFGVGLSGIGVLALKAAPAPDPDHSPFLELPHVRVADITGDSRFDVVAVLPNGKLKVFRHQDGGSFQPDAIANIGEGLVLAEALDVDGDWRTDILIGNNDGLVYFSDSGSEGFVPHAISSDPQWVAPGIGHGYHGTKFATFTPSGLQLHRRDEETGMFVARTLDPNAQGIRGIALRDLNDDGYLDVVTISPEGVTGYLSEGSDGFVAHAIDTSEFGPSHLSAGPADAVPGGFLVGSDRGLTHYQAASNGSEGFEAHLLSESAGEVSAVHPYSLGYGESNYIVGSPAGLQDFRSIGSEGFAFHGINGGMVGFGSTGSEGFAAHMIDAGRIDAIGIHPTLGSPVPWGTPLPPNQSFIAVGRADVTLYESNGSEGYLAHAVETDYDTIHSSHAAYGIQGQYGHPMHLAIGHSKGVDFLSRQGSEGFAAHTLHTFGESTDLPHDSPEFREYMAGFEGIPAGEMGPYDDPDLDGVPNVAEFAMGSVPNSGLNVALARPRLEIAVNPHDDGHDYLQLRYIQRIGGEGDVGIDYTVHGIIYRVEVAESLQDTEWNHGDEWVELIDRFDNGDGTETVLVRTTQPIPESGELYLRLSLY